MSETLWRHLPDLLLVYAAFAVAVASPGPSNMAIMSTAMEVGRGPGLALAAGVASGSFTWGILAAAGVTAMIAGHPVALYAVKIAGGVYLLYLGWRSGRAALRTEAPAAAPAVSAERNFRRIWLRGYLMHLTNPKAILGWTAIIALGLPPDPPMQVVLAILIGCGLISAAINGFYALLFSTPPMVRGYRRCRRAIEGALAGLFAFAGLKLLTSKM